MLKFTSCVLVLHWNNSFTKCRLMLQLRLASFLIWVCWKVYPWWFSNHSLTQDILWYLVACINIIILFMNTRYPWCNFEVTILRSFLNWWSQWYRWYWRKRWLWNDNLRCIFYYLIHKQFILIIIIVSFERKAFRINQIKWIDFWLHIPIC